MRTSLILSIAGIALAAAASAAPQSSPDQLAAIAGDPPFAPRKLILRDIPKPTGPARALFNGRDLTGWSPWLGYPDPAITYRATPGDKPLGTGGPIAAAFTVGRIDGKPAIRVDGKLWGNLTHRDDLSSYHLRLQYRWGDRTWPPRVTEPQNNGLLYHSHGAPGAVFGTWMTAVEFEIMRDSVGMVVPVGNDVRIGTEVAHDPSIIYPHRRFAPNGRRIDLTSSKPAWNVEAASNAERPVGQWNTLDLYVVGDRAVHVVNGVPVMVVHDLAEIDPATTKRTPLTHGRIQLQSEGAETWFRDITVEPIAALPRVEQRR